MKSFIPINIDKSCVDWRVGLDDKHFKNVGNDVFLFDEWNIGLDLYAEATIKSFVIPECYRRSCLDDGAILGICFSWFCPSTSLRGVLQIKKIDASLESFSCVLMSVINGKQIAEEIILSVDVVIISVGKNSNLNKFAKLGEIATSIIIEGKKAQFPIQKISFKQEEDFKQYKTSLYRLCRDLSFSELTDLFSNTYTLYFNSDSPFCDLLNYTMEDLQPPEEAIMKLLLFSVYSDILRDMVEFFRRHDIASKSFIEEFSGEKKAPEMLGSVFFHIVSIISCEYKKDERNTFAFIRENPIEAISYLQSYIFKEEK